MNQLEFALENYKNVQELIKFIDQKAGATLVVYGFILSIFIEVSNDLVIVNPINLPSELSKKSILLFIIGLLLVCVLLYQIFILLLEVIRPRKAKYYIEKEKSLIYYEHIISKEKSQYIKDFKNIEDAIMLNEVLAQIYEVSKILDRKTKKISESIKYLVFAIVLLLFFIYLNKLI